MEGLEVVISVLRWLFSMLAVLVPVGAPASPALARPLFGFTEIATVPVGRGPATVAVNSATNRIYTGNTGDRTISVIDGATNTVVHTIPVPSPSDALRLAINPSTNRLYVAAYVTATASSIFVLDGTTGTSIATIGGFGGIRRLEVDPVANRLYVDDLGTIRVVDGTTSTVIPLAFPGPSGEGDWFVINPTTNRLYIQTVSGGLPPAPPPGQLMVFDALTGSQISTISGAPSGPVAVNPVTNRLFVIDYRLDRFVVLDGATDAIIAQQDLSSLFPHLPMQTLDVAVNHRLNRVYIMTTSAFVVVDGNTNRYENPLFTLQGLAFASNPATGRLYSVRPTHNDLQVIGDFPTTPTPVVPELPLLAQFAAGLLALNWTGACRRRRRTPRT